jgi:hypothetical protein
MAKVPEVNRLLAVCLQNHSVKPSKLACRMFLSMDLACLSPAILSLDLACLSPVVAVSALAGRWRPDMVLVKRM